jgi:DNA-binding CsgD family transcriptional regulator
MRPAPASFLSGGLRRSRGDAEDRLRRILTGILLAMGVGGTVDLALDRPATIWSLHVLFEIGLLAFALGAAAYLGWGWRSAGDSLARTRRELARRGAERDAWRARTEQILRGLGDAIDEQLRAWRLTPAERETAIFLLKGCGHKEIAALQDKSERTVRQHAISVYRKSGLSGRAELSAFFLEDLLLPRPEDAPADVPAGGEAASPTARDATTAPHGPVLAPGAVR